MQTLRYPHELPLYPPPPYQHPAKKHVSLGSILSRSLRRRMTQGNAAARRRPGCVMSSRPRLRHHVSYGWHPGPAASPAVDVGIAGWLELPDRGFSSAVRDLSGVLICRVFGSLKCSDSSGVVICRVFGYVKYIHIRCSICEVFGSIGMFFRDMWNKPTRIIWLDGVIATWEMIMQMGILKRKFWNHFLR